MSQSKKYKYSNRLVNERSPYLLQHAHQPVDWYPWCEEALEKAKSENKLLLISIGYSACHWCHVMAHESFEAEDLAKIMNENFVCIKVDREERPDIDQIYMTAVQLMTNSGGWPLNCFALPNGNPVYGGTYFYPLRWREVLISVANSYTDDPERIVKHSKEIKRGVAVTELINYREPEYEYSANIQNQMIDSIKPELDILNGGFRDVPKFPLPSALYCMLCNYPYSNDQFIIQHIITTLQKMAFGGIFDHIGGGFARYATDRRWRIPHFEKMLYDNGQLISLYSKAFQLTHSALLKQTVKQTIEFINREMTSSEGAFYSSVDADSETGEGIYYAWKKKEIKKVLGQDEALFCKLFNVTSPGNWKEDYNILYINQKYEEIARRFNLPVDALLRKTENMKKTLFLERSHRVVPSVDTKTIVAWNALMIKGLVDAYRTFDNENYIETAINCAYFIIKKAMNEDNSLNRIVVKNSSYTTAFVDDYAFTIEAFISLYQATFNEKWIKQAKALTEYTLKHFFDEKSGMFFYTPDTSDELISRKMELTDDVLPSSNSVIAGNLFLLGIYFNDNNYIQISKQMLDNVIESIYSSPRYYSNWMVIMNYFTVPVKEIVIVGENAIELRKEFDQWFLPNVVFAGSLNEGSLPVVENRFVEGSTYIYICEDRVCKMPLTDINDALKYLNIVNI